MRALSLKHGDWSQRAIADALGVSEPAVSQWLTAARRGGPNALRSHSTPGRDCRLTIQQPWLIPEFLWHGPEAYGFRGQVWTCAAALESSQRSSASATTRTTSAVCSRSCNGPLRCRSVGLFKATSRRSKSGVLRSGPNCGSRRGAAPGAGFRGRIGVLPLAGVGPHLRSRGTDSENPRAADARPLVGDGWKDSRGQGLYLGAARFPQRVARDRVSDAPAGCGGSAIADDLGWFAHPPSDGGWGFRRGHTWQDPSGSAARLLPRQQRRSYTNPKRASEGSGAFPSLARRVNVQQHAELPCRGNTPRT